MRRWKHHLARLIAPLYYYRSYRKLVGELERCFSRPYPVYCFFPAYHTGGAERVHAQILEALCAAGMALFITNKSKNKAFLQRFKSAASCMLDFQATGNHAFYRRRLAAHLARHLNKIQHPAMLFGCNSELFYEVLALTNNPCLRKADLLHAFAPYQRGIEHTSIRFVRQLDVRIVINEQTKSDYRQQYLEQGIPETYLQRIQVIPNASEFACTGHTRSFSLPLRCLFIGRDSVEKRFHLYRQIAASCRGLPIRFSAAGDMKPADDGIDYLGHLTDPDAVRNVYARHDLILCTSVYEGFPMTFIEGMCEGCIPVSTDVGGIPEHIRNGENGFLITTQDQTESEIAGAFSRLLKKLLEQHSALVPVSAAASTYAKEHFDPAPFAERYRALLLR